MKTDDADVNGIHILFLREGALQVVTALKSDEVHVIWLRVDERVDSRPAPVDSPHNKRESSKMEKVLKSSKTGVRKGHTT